MTAPARFKLSDVTRVIKAVKRAGEAEAKVVLEPNGNIVILTGRLAKADEPNPWDEDDDEA